MAKFETKIKDDVFYFKYLEMAATVEEAKEQAAFVKSELSKPGIKKFLNDNSHIKTVAKPEVSEIWGELMEWVAGNVDKNATITPSVTLKMQLNRLSKKAGTYESVRAFTDLDQALAFIGAPDFKM